jgi:serine phosphatase RsbU (regulator of sigma subunit)
VRPHRAVLASAARNLRIVERSAVSAFDFNTAENMGTTNSPYNPSIPNPGRALLQLEQELTAARDEIKNLFDITAPLVPQPGEIPEIRGIDIYGESIQLHGPLGGDHIIFLDFNKRYDIDERIKRAQRAGKEAIAKKLESTRKKAGILVADVAGHSLTDAALAGRLHEAFLACALYELDIYGTITRRLFETLNIRFYNSTSAHKFITMIYGEVSEEGTFQFISAAHPTPIVFSNEFDRIVDISPDRFATFPPLGTQPPEYHVDKRTIKGNSLGYKAKYEINEINLMGQGDIMIIYTDGLSDHKSDSGVPFFGLLEEKLRSVKHLSSRDIGRELKEAISASGRPSDDITYVVIKKD